MSRATVKTTPRRALAAGALAAVVLSACAGPTWRSALEAAQQRPLSAARAELTLVVEGDAARAAELAEEVLHAAQPGSEESERAMFALIAASDALGAVERPIPWLPASLDHLLDGRDDSADAARATRAVRLIAQAQRAWARLDGEPAASPEVAAALERLVGRIEALGGTLADVWEPARAQALRELITAKRLGSGLTASAAAAGRAGFIQDWRLSAPWGDAWALDFVDALGPETRPLAATESTDASWGLIAVPTTHQTFSDGEVTFFDVPASGGVGFAQATVGGATDPERAVVLRLETNRLAAVFVDGGPESSAVASRVDPSQPWLVEVPLQLAAGPRRITVKLATPDGKGFFRLQLTPLTVVRASLATAPLDNAKVGDGRAAVLGLIDLEGRLSRPRWDPDGARSRVAALERQWVSGPERRSSGGGPLTSLDLLSARLALGDTTTPQAERRQLARKSYEAILARDPMHQGARRGLARIEREDERLDRAMELLQPGVADPRTALDLLDLLRDRGWEAEALALIGTLRPRAAASPRIMQELIDTLRAFGRSSQALEAARELEARYPGIGTERLYELEADRGAPPIERELALFGSEPQRHAVLRTAVAGLRAQGRLDEAMARVEAFLVQRPNDGWALGEKARIALQAGRIADARQAIDDALRWHPDFAPLESLTDHLADRPEPFDVLEDGRAVLARWQAFAKTPEGQALASQPVVPVVQVLERTRTLVRPDGSTLELAHRIRLVQTKQGADALGDVRPPEGARLLVVRTLKADGRVLEPERTEGKAELSFPELNPGDAVETGWVTRSRALPSEGGYLTGVSFSSWGAPIFELEASFEVPAGLDLEVTSFGGAPTPTRSAVADGGTRLAWKLGPRPAIPREPMAVSARSFFPFADLRLTRAAGPGDASVDAHVAAWRRIARAYAARLVHLERPGPRLTERARALAAQPDPVLAAFEWVKTEIADQEQLNAFETAAEAAIAAKKGNRAMVLDALLQIIGAHGQPGSSSGTGAADIATELLLCAPERDGPSEDRARPTPNANRFFYPVLVVTRPGKAVLHLDPSRPYNPSGDLPPELWGAACLAPRATGAGLFRELPRLTPPPTFVIRAVLALDKNGDARGTLELEARGAQASPLRQAYLAQDEERQRVFLEQWVGSLVPGARLTRYAFFDLAGAERPMRWSLDLEIPGWAQMDDGALVIQKPMKPLLASDLAGVAELANLVGAPARRTPLRILPHVEAVTLEIRAPSGFTPTAAPAAVNLRGLSQEASIKGASITLSRAVRLTPGRVAPADYPAFRAELGEVIRAFEAPLRFAPRPE